ncbi:Mitogen-activated protein kinase HOG1, partial [Pseudolycoriella hygida]
EHRTGQFVFISKFESEYTILDVLGKGGFGIVYKCTSKDNPKGEVAVKLMEILSKYPEQEARILKQLKHENILEIISDWTEHPPKKYQYLNNSLDELTNDVYFIETEYCDLKSLNFWFRQRVLISHLNAKIILYQISKGLKYLHELETQIVHRDLKPENILLASDKQKSCVVVKIGDFGISRVVTKATMTNIGTEFYKCPEVAMGKGKYHHKVDIYALGVIFCEMLVLGDCSDDEFENRENAIVLDKIKENGFSLSESCKEYLKDNIPEQDLITEMVQLPGIERPEASAVIEKLLTMTPNIPNEKMDIPIIREAENMHEFRLYGKEASEKFIDIPNPKKGAILHTLDLNFVSVNAVHLASCLKECVNLNSIEMSVFNEDDGLFPKISLPKLRKFFYRQLNGPKDFHSYLTED